MAERSGGEVLDAYRERGLAGRVGFGARPGVLVVDFMKGFTDPASPLGANLEAEVKATSVLLAVARGRRVPVLFTVTAYDEGMRDAGLFARKVPSLATLARGSEWVEIDERLAPRGDETVIDKKYASSFFGTHLAATLTALGIDTLLIAGCTTSGCVRATVVDALQNGFRAIVPPECVGDRAPEPHAANLVDIDGKYGDVVPLDDCLAYLDGLPGAASE